MANKYDYTWDGLQFTMIPASLSMRTAAIVGEIVFNSQWFQPRWDGEQVRLYLRRSSICNDSSFAEYAKSCDHSWEHFQFTMIPASLRWPPRTNIAERVLNLQWFQPRWACEQLRLSLRLFSNLNDSSLAEMANMSDYSWGGLQITMILVSLSMREATIIVESCFQFTMIPASLGWRTGSIIAETVFNFQWFQPRWVCDQPRL